LSVSDGRLYTMGLEGSGPNSNIVVYCLDAVTGTNLWRYEYPIGGPADYARPGAMPTVCASVNAAGAWKTTD